LSERRKRVHDLLLTLVNKDSEFEFIEEDSSDLTSSYSEKDTLNLSRVIEKNRNIIKRYQAIVRTAVTLDALMDSENEENFKIKYSFGRPNWLWKNFTSPNLSKNIRRTFYNG